MTRMTKTCGLLATAALFATTADTAAAAPAKLVRAADASTSAQQAFMNARFWRLRSATPLGWSANTWVTQHAFGLDPADAAAHPEWRLLDSTSRRSTSAPAWPPMSATRPSARGGSPRRRPRSRSATAG